MIIKVNIGDGTVSKAPNIICSQGAGSCVIITLYDTRLQIGGLAHVMLPASNSVKYHQHPYQYADTAIATILGEMNKEGSNTKYIVAKIAGGAKMFSSYYYDNDQNVHTECIGDQNIKSIKDILKNRHIPIIGEDIRGNRGRSVEFYLDSGRVVVKTTGEKDKDI